MKLHVDFCNVFVAAFICGFPFGKDLGPLLSEILITDIFDLQEKLNIDLVLNYCWPIQEEEMFCA